MNGGPFRGNPIPEPGILGNLARLPERLKLLLRRGLGEALFLTADFPLAIKGEGVERGHHRVDIKKIDGREGMIRVEDGLLKSNFAMCISVQKPFVPRLIF